MEILLEREWLPQSTCQSTSKESADVDAGKSVEEVLDITEAAIRALNNPPQGNRSLGTTHSSVISAVRNCGSILSPNQWHSDSGFQYVFTGRQFAGSVENSGIGSESHTDNGTKQTQDSRRGSMDSKSSTASDVLKKATTLTDHDISLTSTVQFNLTSLGNQSNVSAASDSKSNVSNSGFLTGNLKKVKLSSKKLKEVDSPFDESILSQNISKFSGEELPESLVKRNLSEVKKQKKESRKKLPSGEKEDVFPSNREKMSRSHKRDMTPRTPPRPTAEVSSAPHQEFSGLFSPLSSVEHIRNGDNFCEVLYHSASVERHIPVDVIVHLTSPSESSIGSDTKVASVSKGNKEGLTDDILFMDEKQKQSPRSGIKQQTHGNSPKGKIISIKRHDKCAETEIITVPENIVTVQARDGNLSQASASSLNSEGEVLQKEPVTSTSKDCQREPQLLMSQSKPVTSKNHFHRGLLQGAAVEGSDPSQVKNTEDTVITQFNLTEKQKHLKNSIAKSRQVSVPVKRLVQPKIVRQEKKERKAKTDQTSGSDAIVDPITTAAVAASAAVAATQPFLQAQREVEHKMAHILERLTLLQPGNSLTSTGDSGVGLESLRYQRNDRMSQLEKQVENLTLKRLDHIEKMQQQYMNVQAQLLGISRDRPGETPGGNLNHLRSPPGKGKYRPVESEEASEKKTKANEKILDTPAPRRTAPTPVVYEAPPVQETKLDQDTPVKRTKSRGLLETILAETQSPPYEKTPPTARTLITSDEQESSDIVHDLKDLKTQMKRVLNEVENVNTDLRNQQSPKKPEIKISPRHFEDAPLDAYMRMKEPEGLSSPYPIVEKDQGNAPVRDNYKDAQEVLHYVRQSRHLLEANLQAILRKRNEADVFTLLEQLSTDSISAQKFNIRKKVDDQITSMKSDLEREILEELLKIEETKERSFMIPERDVNHGKVTAGRGQVRGRPGTGGRGGVSSRVDSGLRKPVGRDANLDIKKTRDNAGPIRPTGPIKTAVKPNSKPKPPVKPYETEEYMTRVYGKADYQNQRSMNKPAPYLHYQTTVKPKPSRPAPKVVSPDSKSKHHGDHYYFSAAGQPTGGPGSPVGPAQGKLIHMAVPLGKPRQEHTGPPPSALVTSTPQATSTPLMQTPQTQRVTFINIRDQDDEEKEKSQDWDKKSKKPNLTVQTLPQVNIDVDVPNVESGLSSPAVLPYEKNMVGIENILEQGSDEDDHSPEDLGKTPEPSKEDEEMENENIDSKEVIALPGFQLKKGTYYGPSFPPKAPPMSEPTSNVLAGDIHRRELLQTQATQWLEQELMARVLSDIASRQPEHPAHSQQMVNHQQDIEEDSESAIVDAIGEAGFQMFVEIGMDVDDDLVRSLIHQVILEKIQATLAHRNQERPSTPDIIDRQSPVPKPRSRSTTTPRQHSEPERNAGTPIPTPQPTPVGSVREDLEEEESVIYTPDPSMSLSSEKDPPLAEDNKENQEDEVASDYNAPPAFEHDDRRTAATPDFSPRSEHHMATPDPSIRDLPSPPRGVDVGVGPDFNRETEQPMWGSGQPWGVSNQPFWNMAGPGSPFVPVLVPAGQNYHQLFNQLPIGQGAQPGPAEPQPSTAGQISSDKKDKKKPKPPPSPEPESESEPEPTSVPFIRPDVNQTKGNFTAGRAKSPKVIMVDQPTSPASNMSQESMVSDTMNYVSEGQWLISARSEGEIRNNHPYFTSSSLLPRDDTFHDTDELEPDEISEGEIIQRLQNLQNPVVLMANQLNQRPLSFIENRFRYSQPAAVPSRSMGETNPSTVRNQVRSLPTVVRVQEQLQNENDYSPGEVPNMQQPPLIPQSQPSPRPSTSRGISSRGLEPNQANTPNRSSLQGAQGGARSQNNIPSRQNPLSRSDERGPMRLADMRKRGGVGSGPIRSTAERPTRSQGRRSRPASQELIVDSRDTLAGTISGGTFSHDSREFLVSNDSFQSGRSLNILDLHTDNLAETTGTISERDLRTPDQMNIDEILHSPEYLGHTFSQSELGSTGWLSEGGMTRSLGRSGLQRQDTRESERAPNDDLGASGQFLDSLESSLTTDKLVQRQPHSINSTQDGFNWLIGAQRTQGSQNGRSLMATVNLESTTSVEEGSEGQQQGAPRSLSVQVPLMSQQESSDESTEDVSDL